MNKIAPHSQSSIYASGLFVLLLAVIFTSTNFAADARSRWAISSKRSSASHIDPPVTVLSTDELYKPALLKDGRLIAVALAMVEGVQHAVAMYSFDNGHSWSKPSKLFNLPADEGTFGYFDFLADRAGELHFFFLLDPSTSARWRRAHAQASSAEAELDIWHLKSGGNRTAWSTPKRIWQGRAGDLLSVIQLDSGRVLLPICYRTSRNWAHRGSDFEAYRYTGQFDSSALYSDDDGESWHQSRSVLKTPTPDIETIEGAIEPVALQLKDGRVWMLIRTQMGRFYESYSADNGETWSPAAPTSLVSSDSPAGLVRLQDGRIVMLLNRSLRFPYAYGGRHALQAAISTDEARTWHGYREVVRDPLRNDPPPPSGDFGASYPYPTITQDGKVLFAMAVATGTRNAEPKLNPGFTPRQKRDLVLLDPDWLLEKSQRSDFSDGLDHWSAFGVKGVEVVSDRSDPNAHVLRIRRTDPSWPAAAVWNFPMGKRGDLSLKLMLKEGFQGAVIGLTDYYSVPYDPEDSFHNVCNLRIPANGQLPGGTKLKANRWYRIDIAWDTDGGQATVTVDQQEAETLRLRRESEGLGYLRLRSTAENVDLAGLLVEWVAAKIQPIEQRQSHFHLQSNRSRRRDD